MPHGFSEQDQAVGTELNDVAAILIQNSVSYWGAFELTQQLDDALSSRATIEQAKGVLMATTPGLDPEGAFDLLRRASQREHQAARDRPPDRRAANPLIHPPHQQGEGFSTRSGDGDRHPSVLP